MFNGVVNSKAERRNIGVFRELIDTNKHRRIARRSHLANGAKDSTWIRTACPLIRMNVNTQN